MDIKVDVKAEDVEKAVKDAIIDSAIGRMIQEKVRQATSDYAIGNAVETVIRHAIAEHCRTMIREDEALAAKLKAAIVEKLDTDFIDRMAAKIARAVDNAY